MDSGTVADALAKAYQGNFKALRSLTPEMATMIKEGASLNEIMDVLGGTFGGATAKSAETAAGKMKILTNSLGETKESIGAALLPVLEAVLPVLNSFAAWAQDNPQAFLAIAGAIGLVAAAIVATNIAMALNPFALIAAGVALLVAALVVAYNKFEWFRTGVNAIINGILNAFESVVNGAIMMVNGIIRAYNAIPIAPDIKTISHVNLPNVGASNPTQVAGRMNLPRLAEGGIVNSPTLALIGEAGPEAVVPLDRMQNGGGITINVTGGLATSAEIGESVVNALRAYSRSAGPLQLQVA
jgi:small-conductance mechanosensitive channel